VNPQIYRKNLLLLKSETPVAHNIWTVGDAGATAILQKLLLEQTHEPTGEQTGEQIHEQTDEPWL